MKRGWLLIAVVTAVALIGAPEVRAQNLIQNSGWVGISTMTPGSELDVNGRIRMTQSSNFSEFFTGNSGGVMGLHIGSRSNMPISLYTNSSGPQFLLTTSGNVGIGTTSPAALLHVAGNVQVDGNIAAKYQDVAEWVPTTTRISPGTVVVIDALNGTRVLPAAEPYDTRVAGVVSAKPGILLGEPGDDKVSVAHSGRLSSSASANSGMRSSLDSWCSSPK